MNLGGQVSKVNRGKGTGDLRKLSDEPREEKGYLGSHQRRAPSGHRQEKTNRPNELRRGEKKK